MTWTHVATVTGTPVGLAASKFGQAAGATVAPPSIRLFILTGRGDAATIVQSDAGLGAALGAAPVASGFDPGLRGIRDREGENDVRGIICGAHDTTTSFSSQFHVYGDDVQGFYKIAFSSRFGFSHYDFPAVDVSDCTWGDDGRYVLRTPAMGAAQVVFQGSDGGTQQASDIPTRIMSPAGLCAGYGIDIDNEVLVADASRVIHSRRRSGASDTWEVYSAGPPAAGGSIVALASVPRNAPAGRGGDWPNSRDGIDTDELYVFALTSLGHVYRLDGTVPVIGQGIPAVAGLSAPNSTDGQLTVSWTAQAGFGTEVVLTTASTGAGVTRRRVVLAAGVATTQIDLSGGATAGAALDYAISVRHRDAAGLVGAVATATSRVTIPIPPMPAHLRTDWVHVATASGTPVSIGATMTERDSEGDATTIRLFVLTGSGAAKDIEVSDNGLGDGVVPDTALTTSDPSYSEGLGALASSRSETDIRNVQTGANDRADLWPYGHDNNRWYRIDPGTTRTSTSRQIEPPLSGTDILDGTFDNSAYYGLNMVTPPEIVRRRYGTDARSATTQIAIPTDIVNPAGLSLGYRAFDGELYLGSPSGIHRRIVDGGSDVWSLHSDPPPAAAGSIVALAGCQRRYRSGGEGFPTSADGLTRETNPDLWYLFALTSSGQVWRRVMPTMADATVTPAVEGAKASGDGGVLTVTWTAQPGYETVVVATTASMGAGTGVRSLTRTVPDGGAETVFEVRAGSTPGAVLAYSVRIEHRSTGGVAGDATTLMAMVTVPIDPPPVEGLMASVSGSAIAVSWTEQVGFETLVGIETASPGAGSGVQSLMETVAAGTSSASFDVGQGSTPGATLDYTVSVRHRHGTTDGEVSTALATVNIPLVAPHVRGLRVAAVDGRLLVRWQDGGRAETLVTATTASAGAGTTVRSLSATALPGESEVDFDTTVGSTPGAMLEYTVSVQHRTAGGATGQAATATGMVTVPQPPPAAAGVTASGDGGVLTVRWADQSEYFTVVTATTATAGAGENVQSLESELQPVGPGNTQLPEVVFAVNDGSTPGTDLVYSVSVQHRNVAGAVGTAATAMATVTVPPVGVPAAQGVAGVTEGDELVVVWTAAPGYETTVALTTSSMRVGMDYRSLMATAEEGVTAARFAIGPGVMGAMAGDDIEYSAVVQHRSLDGTMTGTAATAAVEYRVSAETDETDGVPGPNEPGFTPSTWSRREVDGAAEPIIDNSPAAGGPPPPALPGGSEWVRVTALHDGPSSFAVAVRQTAPLPGGDAGPREAVVVSDTGYISGNGFGDSFRDSVPWEAFNNLQINDYRSYGEDVFESLTGEGRFESYESPGGERIVSAGVGGPIAFIRLNTARTNHPDVAVFVRNVTARLCEEEVVRRVWTPNAPGCTSNQIRRGDCILLPGGDDETGPALCTVTKCKHETVSFGGIVPLTPIRGGGRLSIGFEDAAATTGGDISGFFVARAQGIGYRLGGGSVQIVNAVLFYGITVRRIVRFAAMTGETPKSLLPSFPPIEIPASIQQPAGLAAGLGAAWDTTDPGEAAFAGYDQQFFVADNAPGDTPDAPPAIWQHVRVRDANGNRVSRWTRWSDGPPRSAGRVVGLASCYGSKQSRARAGFSSIGWPLAPSVPNRDIGLVDSDSFHLFALTRDGSVYRLRGGPGPVLEPSICGADLELTGLDRRIRVNWTVQADVTRYLVYYRQRPVEDVEPGPWMELPYLPIGPVAEVEIDGLDNGVQHEVYLRCEHEGRVPADTRPQLATPRQSIVAPDFGTFTTDGSYIAWFVEALGVSGRDIRLWSGEGAMDPEELDARGIPARWARRDAITPAEGTYHGATVDGVSFATIEPVETQLDVQRRRCRVSVVVTPENERRFFGTDHGPVPIRVYWATGTPVDGYTRIARHFEGRLSKSTLSEGLYTAEIETELGDADRGHPRRWNANARRSLNGDGFFDAMASYAIGFKTTWPP